MCSADQSAISTWPVGPAGTADRRHYWRNMIAACSARSQLASSAGRPFVDAFVESTAADAYSGRAAARIADSGGDSDSGEATAGGSGSSDSSAASRYPLDAAARIDRAVFALVRLAPESTDQARLQ